MDLIRKCSIAVVMMIPAFVFGGLAWSCYHSWWAVLGTDIIVLVIFLQIISGTLSDAKGS